jgi:hypothetical protein
VEAVPALTSCGLEASRSTPTARALPGKILDIPSGHHRPAVSGFRGLAKDTLSDFETGSCLRHCFSKDQQWASTERPVEEMGLELFLLMPPKL